MENARRQTALIIFTVLGGFLAGTAVPELFRMGTGDYASLFSVYSLRKYEHTTVEAVRLFHTLSLCVCLFYCFCG